MRCNIVLCAILLLAGCASIDLENERGGVIASAVDRAGLDAASPEPLPERVGRADAVSHALNHNLDFRAGLADLGLARAELVEASRPGNPVLELVFFPKDDEEDFLEVELAAGLVDVLTTPWRAASARDTYDAAQRRSILTTLDFIAGVERSWTRAVAARQRLQLQANITRAAEAALVVAVELRQAGNIAPIELEREQVFARQARMDLVEAEHASTQAVRALAVLIGAPDLSIDHLPARLDHPSGDIDWPQADTLQAANLMLEAYRLEADALARNAGLENVQSVLEHSELRLIQEREDGEWHDGYGFETALPLFDFGASRRARARILAIQAAERYEAAALTLHTSSGAIAAEWATARTQADMMRDDHLPGVERLMDRTLRQYNAMQLGVFELIATFQSTAAAGSAYVNALERAHIAAIDANLLIAGGWPDMAMASTPSAAAAARPSGDH